MKIFKKMLLILAVFLAVFVICTLTTALIDYTYQDYLCK